MSTIPMLSKNILCPVKLTANSSILGKARHGIALSGGTLEALLPMVCQAMPLNGKFTLMA